MLSLCIWAKASIVCKSTVFVSVGVVSKLSHAFNVPEVPCWITCSMLLNRMSALFLELFMLFQGLPSVPLVWHSFLAWHVLPIMSWAYHLQSVYPIVWWRYLPDFVQPHPVCSSSLRALLSESKNFISAGSTEAGVSLTVLCAVMTLCTLGIQL